MHLYEAHLPVSDTEAAQRFYIEIVGLQFAHRDLTRDIVFLWAGTNRRSMLGLWGPSTTYGSEFHKCHIAFNFPLAELLAAGERLNAAAFKTENFAGEETSEPSVIGWMPSAQLYFHDRDDHLLEFIALLHEPPEPEFVGSLSEWTAVPSYMRFPHPLTGWSRAI
jgi:lactoylglutathione lyase